MIFKRIRLFKRYRQILGTFIRNGFGFLSEIMPFFGRMAAKRHAKRNLMVDTAVRIRQILEELGPIYIKFAQVLSTRPDIIPDEITNELTKLQDSAPPLPFDAVQEQIQQSLGKSWQTHFKDIDPEPVATASIAQVHRAFLFDGTEVAIKVKRPNLEKKIEADLIILMDLAQRTEKLMPHLKQFKLVELVEEFNRVLQMELDLSREGRNLEVFAKNFANDPDIVFPKVHWDYTKNNILVMEYIHGIKLSRVLHDEIPEQERERIANAGSRAISKMVFRHAFFHADPHPGNIFLLPDHRICFLDCGMVGIIDHDTADFLAEMMHCIITNDPSGIINVFVENEIIPENVNMRTLREKVNQLFEQYYDLSLQNIEVAKFSNDLLDIIRAYNLQVHSSLLLLIKILIIYEGLARQLFPAYNPIQELRPYVEEMYFQKFNPKHLASDFVETARHTYNFLKAAPTELAPIMRKLKRGDLQIHAYDPATQEQLPKIEYRIKQLNISIIWLGCMISGTWAAVSEFGIAFFGLSLFSWITFGIALILLIYLLFFNQKKKTISK